MTDTGDRGAELSPGSYRREVETEFHDADGMLFRREDIERCILTDEDIRTLKRIAEALYEVGALGLSRWLEERFPPVALASPSPPSGVYDSAGNRTVERYEDMTRLGRLRLIFQPDGDAIVAIVPDPDEPDWRSQSVEFCAVGAGGGRSPHTIRALRALAAAITRDNTETPIRR
jgi:hypothetical protein